MGLYADDAWVKLLGHPHQSVSLLLAPQFEIRKKK